MGLFTKLTGLEDIIDKGLDIVDKFVKDKDQAAKLKHEIKSQIEDNTHERDIQKLKSQTEIITGEIDGESPAQRNWRPHLMYFIMFLLAFNGVIVPLGNAMFGADIPALEAWNAIPGQLWQLLMIGMGGYIGGRTGEKMFREWRKSKKNQQQ